MHLLLMVMVLMMYSTERAMVYNPSSSSVYMTGGENWFLKLQMLIKDGMELRMAHHFSLMLTFIGFKPFAVMTTQLMFTEMFH